MRADTQMPDSLFFILEGDVEMLDEGAVLRLLKQGDTFGEEAVLCNITTPLEYRSASFCRALLMPRAELQVSANEAAPTPSLHLCELSRELTRFAKI
jgi:CRP-like cAMP-binding protein